MMAQTLIIVGAGNAGMPAAIEAADRGANVILVEKTDQLGGMLHWSSATMSAAGARMQKAKGIVDSPQLHFEDCMRIGRGRNDPAILRLAVENAAETIDWLESIGVPYTAESPRFAPEHPLYSVPRSYYANQPGPSTTGGFRGGGIIFEKLNKELQKRIEAGKVDVRLKTKMTGLIVEEGRVVGIRAEANGQPVEIRGDAVILTTGGYMANPQLMQKYHPVGAKLVTLCGPHATGDAIPIVEAIGGTTVNMDLLIPLLGFVEDPENPGYARPGITLHYGRNPAISGDIWVNANGERFIAEDTKDPDAKERAIMSTPGWVMWAIFDDLMRQGFTKEINELTRRLGLLGLITSAPTIEELAEKIGVPPANLRRTVDEYNAAVESGNDRLGRKEMPKAIDEPPFHAIRSDGVTILSQGGIKVNSNLQVVRADGTPIEGLYAAGEVLGAGQVMGDAFCSGMSAGAAVTTGRLAVRFALGIAAPAAV
ncbi:MAG: FAD-dependent oxidoreductase [Chloroflexota bacterium]|nr:FAD-dependent oxidoreductase [Dehalococcoidia bacterium]MDW8255245.1 FAD-dependent oxidoreductase [Chloroflexota bacterium]